MNRLTDRRFETEFFFTTSRSSGPGGQNVNKTETRVELRFHVMNSELLTDEEKELISIRLKNKISSDGYLILNAQDSRSQLTNKLLVTERFYEMLTKALKKHSKRKATKPSARANKRRLISKRYHSLKKEQRNKSSFQSDEN